MKSILARNTMTDITINTVILTIATSSARPTRANYAQVVPVAWKKIKPVQAVET